MSKKIDLSIITLSYNTKQTTREYLKSLFVSLHDAPFSYEVIVVDNASTDGSAAMIRSEFPAVTLLTNKKNIGFGAANNLAVAKARGECVLFLNSDIVILNDAVRKLYDYFNAHKEIDFLGGKLRNSDRAPQASCGPFLTLPIVLLMLFAKGEQLGITRYSPNEAKEVDWISGACVLCRKSDFVSLEGFDEGIFLYMEEVELFYRAKQKGMHVWFTPDAQFIHVGSGSSKEWKTPIMNLYKGLLYFYKKHESPPELFLLRFLLITKALIGIIAGAVFFNKRIFNAYKEGLKVSVS